MITDSSPNTSWGNLKPQEEHIPVRERGSFSFWAHINKLSEKEK